MNLRRVILVIAGSALLGVGLGQAINRAAAGRIKRTAPARAQAPDVRSFVHRGQRLVGQFSSITPMEKLTVDLPPIPPPPQRAAPKGAKSPDGYWVMAPDPSNSNKLTWMRTASSVTAERELALKIIEDGHRAEASGTKINPDAGPKPGTDALRRAIAAAFALANPVPPERQAHFSWIDRNDPGMEIVGWRGHIMAIEPSPQGAIVTILVGATFKHTTTVAYGCTERWLYSSGKLQMLSTHEAHVPGVLMSD